MTTPEAAIARAYELGPIVERQWPGFDAPVPAIWCEPPNAIAGLCTVPEQHHCAGTINRIYYDIGLRQGIDYPVSEAGLHQYCPQVVEDARRGGFIVDEPAPGDEIICQWGDGVPAHATLCVGDDNWPTSVSVFGFNTDETGHGLHHERPAGVVHTIIRPRWRRAENGQALAAAPPASPATPPAPRLPSPIARRPRMSDWTTFVVSKQNGTTLKYDVVGGIFCGRNGPVDESKVTEYEVSWEWFQGWFAAYLQANRFALDGRDLLRTPL